MRGGTIGKIAWIDLSNGRIEVIEPDKAISMNSISAGMG